MMTEYQKIITEYQKKINNILIKIYTMMNEYFENIFNSPSTINRIIIYYAIGIEQDKPFKRFILFQDKIIQEYNITLINGDVE